MYECKHKNVYAAVSAAPAWNQARVENTIHEFEFRRF